MTDEELKDAYNAGSRVRVINSDYSFYGIIDTWFRKRDGKSVRCIVESDERVCLIQSAKNLELVK